MKEKRNCKRNLFIGIILSGVMILCGATAVSAEKKEDYSSLEEYDSYISVIADTSGTYGGNGSFALYDLDQDGVRELITSAGTCLADWENCVYTLEDGKVSMIGSFYNNVILYVAPDGNGLYTVYGMQGHEEINRLIKTGNEIDVQPVQTRELAAGEEYYTNENPVEWQYFNEAAPVSDGIFSGTYESYDEEPIYGEHISFYEKDGVLMADVSVSKKYRETVVMQGNTGTAADGTPVFSIEKTDENCIFVKYHSLTKASKWLTKPGTSAFNYTVEVSASDGGVNMRSGPGTEYDKVLPEMIPNGTRLGIKQESQASNGNSWGFTQYNGIWGWIALTQVTSLEPVEGAPLVEARHVVNCQESITLRSAPDVNSPEICQIPLGAEVLEYITEQPQNGFVRVEYGRYSGYCLEEYLSVSGAVA